MAALAGGSRFEAEVLQKVGEIVALCAECVRAGIRIAPNQAWIYERVLDWTAGTNKREVCSRRHGTELVPALQDVEVDRAVRPIGTLATRLPVIVAVVAVAAEYPHALTGSDGSEAVRRGVELGHVGQQAGLRPGTGHIMQHGMAGAGRGCHL